MKKLLMLALACAYSSSTNAMDGDKPTIAMDGNKSTMSMSSIFHLPAFFYNEVSEPEAVPQSLPQPSTPEEPEVLSEGEWKKLEEQAEQTIFQDCKTAIENRNKNAVNLLSSIPSTITRAQLIGLAKAQAEIDRLQIKQSTSSPISIENYKNSMMVLAGIQHEWKI